MTSVTASLGGGDDNIIIIIILILIIVIILRWCRCRSRRASAAEDVGGTGSALLAATGADILALPAREGENVPPFSVAPAAENVPSLHVVMASFAVVSTLLVLLLVLH